MLITCIFLWTISAILILSKPKSEDTIWGAILTFVSGAGGFSETIVDHIRPSAIRYGLMNENLDSILNILYIVTYFIANTGVAYAFLMFAICYSSLFNEKRKVFLYVILFIPVVVMYFVTPLYPEIRVNFRVFSIWTVPYMVVGDILLIYSYIKEKNPSLKRDRLFLSSIAILTGTFVMFTSYLARCFNNYNMFRYNVIIITILFMAFVVLLVKQNFLGVKLKVEMSRIDRTMKAITSGTRMLNHTLKNEINVISLCCNNAKMGINHENIDIEDVDSNLNLISKATEHLTEMIKRINENIDDIDIEEEDNNIAEIIKNALEKNKVYLESFEIKVDYCNYDIILKCDKVHMVEVFNNIFRNSIEAMQNENIKKKELKITCYNNKKNLMISIQDSGPGISKDNIKYIFDPFFSTKKHSLNFGLGLSYCYNVIQKHRGSLDISSHEGFGTTVIISFDKQKVINMPPTVPQWRMSYYG